MSPNQYQVYANAALNWYLMAANQGHYLFRSVHFHTQHNRVFNAVADPFRNDECDSRERSKGASTYLKSDTSLKLGMAEESDDSQICTTSFGNPSAEKVVT